jgi:DNA-binding response OmpR family regulator
MANSALPVLLLVEPETLLRRTVSLTARSANLAEVTEAASDDTARELLAQRRFDGAVISLDLDTPAERGGPLALLEYLQGTRSRSDTAVPVAVMVERCDAALLTALRGLGVARVIIKPFRARAVIDAIVALGKSASAAPA